jgi:3-oxoacyl-(acyl-carrier-protein) synthase III
MTMKASLKGLLSTKPKVKISGFGISLPEKVVTNKELEKTMDTTEAFIIEKTGVLERRFVTENETNAMLMVNSIHAACQTSKVPLEGIDTLIVNTLSPDFHDPSQACLVQGMLKELIGIPAFDIRAQCAGFLYGTYLANSLILSDAAKHVLVVCGEVNSKRMVGNKEDRNIAVLAGDGAASAVISKADGMTGFLDLSLGADGSYFDLLKTEAPGVHSGKFLCQDDIDKNKWLFKMKGPELFEHATKTIICEIKRIMEKHSIKYTDLHSIISHQPNVRMLEYIANKLDIPKEKFVINAHKYGNTASASLPIAWAESVETCAPGDLSLIIGFGAGSTWGSGIYRH